MFCEVAAWAEILNLFHFVPSDLRFLSEGIDLLKDKQALQRLTEAAEKAKMELSGVQEAWTICRMHMNAICMTVDDHVANLKRSLAFLRVNPYCLCLRHICRLFLGLGRPRSLCPSSPLMPLVPSTLKRACLVQSSSSLRASSSPDAGILGRGFKCLTCRQTKHQMNHAKGQGYVNV